MNDKIKHLLATAYKTDSIAQNKWRIENREQLREQRKKELAELMEKDKTMSNNKQSSVEWYSVKRDVLEIEVRLGKLSANEYAEELAKAEQQAKQMHKEEIIEFAINFTYGTKRVGESIKKDFIKLYNETFGGNNEQQ